jgi:hypothetical protein
MGDSVTMPVADWPKTIRAVLEGILPRDAEPELVALAVALLSDPNFTSGVEKLIAEIAVDAIWSNGRQISLDRTSPTAHVPHDEDPMLHPLEG